METTTQTLKLEAEAEACCVCGGSGEEVFSPEEHDMVAPPAQTPLRAMLLHLNHNKTTPGGRLCAGCAARTVDAYTFSTMLGAKGPAPLSDKIKALRQRLHELTQKINVFIVVGGAAEGEGEGAYKEEDIIMVQRDAVAGSVRGDTPRGHNLRGDTAYQCTVCPRTFQVWSEYRSHAGTHAPDARHSCWSCGAQFSTQAARDRHAATHGPHPAARCGLCGATHQSAAEARQHEATCPSRCPACSALFPSRAALRAHAGTHATLCTHCFKPHDTAEQLRAHVLCHRQASQFVCGYDGCILRFTARHDLLSHIRKCHSGALSPAPAPATAPAPAPALASVPCAHCDRKFASTAAMKRHARVHRDSRPLSHDESAEGGWGVDSLDGKVEYLEVETLEDMDQL